MPIDREKLIVKLEANSAKLQSELEKTQKKLTRFEKAAKRTKASVSKTFAGIAGRLALPAVAGGFGALVTSNLNYIDSLQKLSRRLGISTKALSRFRYVAESTGVRFETLTMGLQRMTRRIAEAANGTGEAVGPLEELNLSAEELIKLSPDEQFKRIADAMAKVTVQGKKVLFAMKLFDDPALLQAMEGGSAALDAMAEKADAAGAVIGDQLAKDAEAATQAITDLGLQFDGLTTRLTTKALPIIQKTTKWMQELRIMLGGGTEEEVGVRDLQKVTEQLEFLQWKYEETASVLEQQHIQKQVADLYDEYDRLQQLLNKETKVTPPDIDMKGPVEAARREILRLTDEQFNVRVNLVVDDNRARDMINRRFSDSAEKQGAKR